MAMNGGLSRHGTGLSPECEVTNEGLDTPSHEERADIVGYLRAVQVFGPHFSVVGGRMVLGVVITKVGFARGPVDFELALANSVLDPVEAHVDGFGSLLLDGAVCEAHCSGVVHLHGCGRLRVSEFNQGSANWESLLAVEKCASDFGFSGGGHDELDNFGKAEDGAIEHGLCGVVDLVAEEVVTACATAGSRFRQVRCVTVDV